MKQAWKAMQNRSVWENSVLLDHDIIRGLEKDIIRLLSISNSNQRVNEVMNKIDLIIEYATEMGMELEKCGCGKSARNNLYRAREERAREV